MSPAGPRIRSTLLLTLTVCGGGIPACRTSDARREPCGKVFFIEGAGGWGIGAAGVRTGLMDAGYRGDVEVFRWSATLNPVLDQLDVFGAARAAGEALAERIADYRRRHPQAAVHLVALSAGSGVAVWACERLRPGCAVDNVILLGSSLSSDYDMTAALRRIRGRVYVYHSPRDAVLATLPVFGTIDREGRGAAAAGQYGLQVRRAYGDRVFNTPWSRHWAGFGWEGGHTDCTRRLFVREELARRILPRPQLAGARR